MRAILARLRDAGRLEGLDLSRLNAPIGLAIGGSTHGEIAVSVVAELVAHRRRSLAGLRQMRLPPDEVARIAGRVRPRPAPEPHLGNGDPGASRAAGNASEPAAAPDVSLGTPPTPPARSH